jgi:hypothetical protein
MLSLMSNPGIQLAGVGRKARMRITADVSSEMLDQRYDRQNPQRRE